MQLVKQIGRLGGNHLLSSSIVLLNALRRRRSPNVITALMSVLVVICYLLECGGLVLSHVVWRVAVLGGEQVHGRSAEEHRA